MSTPDPASRYDTSVDLGNENTSHSQIVRLVGQDKRVLDVGCATGYLAAALRSQGCSVSGIEYEPAAAEKARPHLDSLVVGSVDELDLVAEFGVGSFDVVVYGDVLEHLIDPVGTLRRSVPLLAQGGAVVASIPHVAHGAVRLALLDGRFQYTETGLLDDTHVRFFTVDLVMDTFRRAGLAPVRLARTTADLADTEIPLDLPDYPEPVLRRVLADPEATTYQFVVRAVPEAEADPADLAALADEQRERRAQHVAARRMTSRTPREQGYVPASAAGEIGLWGAFELDDVRQALLVRTTRTELERRLPGVRLRTFSPYGSERPSRIDVGEAVEPLSGGRGDEVAAAALDVVIVTGLLVCDPHGAALLYGEAAGEDHAALALGRGPAHGGVPVLWSAVDLHRTTDGNARAWLERHGGAATVLEGTAPAGTAACVLPDPGLLARQVFDPVLLERRLSYLRAVEAYPRGGLAVVVQVDARSAEHLPALAEALSQLSRPGLTTTLVLTELHAPEGDGDAVHALRAALPLPTTVLPVSAGLDDLVAALAGADAVVASSPTALAVARAFDVPSLALDLTDDPQLARWPGRATNVAELHARIGELASHLLSGTSAGPPDTATVAARAALQQHFDDLAVQVADAVRARRAAEGEPDLQIGLSERLAALEASHAAVRAAANRERVALSHLAPPQPVVQVDATAAVLRAELEAIMASKTMRVLRPARAAYARLRGRAL